MSKIVEIEDFNRELFYCRVCDISFVERKNKLNGQRTVYSTCDHINLDRNELLKTFKSEDAVNKISAIYEHLQNEERKFREFAVENKKSNNFIVKYTHLLAHNKLDIYENNKLLLQFSMINDKIMVCYIEPYGVYPKTTHKEFMYVKVGNDKNLCLIGPLDDYIYKLVICRFDM